MTHTRSTFSPHQLPAMPHSLGRHGNLPCLCISRVSNFSDHFVLTQGQEVILYNFLRIHNELASDNTIKTCKGSYSCELDYVLVICDVLLWSLMNIHEFYYVSSLSFAGSKKFAVLIEYQVGVKCSNHGVGPVILIIMKGGRRLHDLRIG